MSQGSSGRSPSGGFHLHDLDGLGQNQTTIQALGELERE